MTRFLMVTFALSIGLLITSTSAGCQTSSSQGISDPLPFPSKDMEYAEGTTEATLVVAGGCFWCIEAVFEEIEGVGKVISGYAGGSEQTANYKDVSRGRSEHAEAVQITFDPTKISFGKLMQIFFTMHKPTQANGQTPDIGKQYRSAVFFANDKEQAVFQAYINQLDESELFEKSIATSVEPLNEFFEAENYHQDYVKLNPQDAYVVQWALPKLDKVRKLFKDELKSKK